MADRLAATITLFSVEINAEERSSNTVSFDRQDTLRQTLDVFRQAAAFHHGSTAHHDVHSFCAAFPTAVLALTAVREALTNLAEQSSLQEKELPIRLAVHSGTAILNNENSLFLSRQYLDCLLSAANFGQALLSSEAHEQAGEQPIPDLAFHDLGIHVLADRYRPEHLYQLILPGVLHTIFPLKKAARCSNNFPHQMQAWVGQDREVEEVSFLLKQPMVRLVTLTGPAGSGKTRLAVEAALKLGNRFEDGIYFVELPSSFHPDWIFRAVLQALGETEPEGATPLENLIQALQQKQVLLLLDHFEQVLNGADSLRLLLNYFPHIKLLVTSRQALQLEEEYEYPVERQALRQLDPGYPLGSFTLHGAAAAQDNLSAREIEVLALIAQGLADAEIAERLGISRRTVNSHVTTIYGKINVKSRVAATRYALEHQLVG